MIRCYVGIMALAMTLFPLAAHAGRGMDRATGQAIWDAAVNGKTTTLGIGQGAMRVIKPTTTGTPVRASGGGASVTDTMPVPVGGVNAPVSVTTNVPKAEIAAAVVGCATGTVVGCAVSAIPLAIAWMSLSGTRLNPQTGALERQETGVCTQAPCEKYEAVAGGLADTEGLLFWSKELACFRLAERLTAVSATYDFTFLSVSGGCLMKLTNKSNGAVFSESSPYGGFRTVAVEPASPTWYPATPQEVKDALYNNDPAPEIIDELSKYGNIIWPGPASVTGPSSVTGPKETSVTNSGNQSTTTTKQTSTPLTYQGASVTAGNPTTTSTSTTTTTNPDGSTSTSSSTTTTTTEEGTSPETPAEEAAPTDTALPPVPDLYQRKYPNGMEGIWNDYKEQLKGTDLVSLVGKLMPNVGDGGSCPTWPINLDLSQWASYGTHDVAPPCWIWDVAKAILILSALLLARALVFGG